MSLIAGIFLRDDEPADGRWMRNVLHGYKEYGPDGDGVWAGGSVALGHLMRHSTPESLTEQLPYATADGRWAITADARIDNRPELMDQLSVSATGRSGLPDSGLILLAWRKWGEDCPPHLEGDFTFAVHDRHRRELFLVQSAFPNSSLYFVRTPRCVAFASLIRPLLTLSGTPKRLDEERFARFASQTIHSSFSEQGQRLQPMFAGVESLPAATTLKVLRDGSIHEQNWWRPDPNRQIRLGSDEQYYEGVRELTFRAVHDRMRSHRPVICSLSGGLDSSSIACIAARRLRASGRKLAAVSSVLPLDHSGPETDERRFIDIVKKDEDLDVTYVHPSQRLLDDQAAYLNVVERPVTNPKQFVQSAFFEASLGRGAGVMLDGVGGEFGPTNHASALFAWLAGRGQWYALASELRATARNTNHSLLRLMFREVLAPYIPNLLRHYRRIRSPARAEELGELPLQPDFLRRHGLEAKYRSAPLSNTIDPKQELSQNIQYLQSLMGVNPSMAYGIRTWYPFLDRRLIEFCLAVPSRLNHVGGWNRNLIRRAMQGVLPEEIRWRKCKGRYSPDYYRRIQNEWQPLRDEFAAIPAGDFVRDYYDVESILRTLDALKGKPGGETSPEGFRLKMCVQFSLAGIRFLRWFQQVNLDVATRTAA